jgi:hypothetical protein
MGRKVPKS